MSKLSFRARALDASKPMPIYMAEELPDLPDYSAINRAVPQMPSGMQKEEECEHHLQRAIVAGLIIPTPEVSDIPNREFYDKVYPANYKQPRQLIHMQPFTMEQDIPDYDMDSDDERWLHSQTQKLDLSPLKFEEMMDKFEKSSGKTAVTISEAKALLKEDDDLIIAVFDYWLNKRLKTQHPLILTVKTEHRTGQAANNPYLAFRRRTEKMQTRKNRKNDEASYEKMLKLRRDLYRAVTLLELVKRREKIKREYVHLSIEVFEKRYQAKDFSGSVMAEATAINKSTRPAFTPIFHNHYPNQSWTNKAILKDDVIPRREKRQYKKRKHKSTSMTGGRCSSSGTGGLGGSLDTIGGGGLSSDDESVVASSGVPRGAASPDPDEAAAAEDESQFAFRRNKLCSYHMPLPYEGNWPWCSPEEHGLADKRFRFTLTSLSNPRRCIGYARRRVGRGGRVILDRVSTPHDDFWRSLDFTILESTNQQQQQKHQQPVDHENIERINSESVFNCSSVNSRFSNNSDAALVIVGNRTMKSTAAAVMRGGDISSDSLGTTTKVCVKKELVDVDGGGGGGGSASALNDDDDEGGGSSSSVVVMEQLLGSAPLPTTKAPTVTQEEKDDMVEFLRSSRRDWLHFRPKTPPPDYEPPCDMLLSQDTFFTPGTDAPFSIEILDVGAVDSSSNVNNYYSSTTPSFSMANNNSTRLQPYLTRPFTFFDDADITETTPVTDTRQLLQQQMSLVSSPQLPTTTYPSSETEGGGTTTTGSLLDDMDRWVGCSSFNIIDESSQHHHQQHLPRLSTNKPNTTTSIHSSISSSFSNKVVVKQELFEEDNNSSSNITSNNSSGSRNNNNNNNSSSSNHTRSFASQKSQQAGGSTTTTTNNTNIITTKSSSSSSASPNKRSGDGNGRGGGGGGGGGGGDGGIGGGGTVVVTSSSSGSSRKPTTDGGGAGGRVSLPNTNGLLTQFTWDVPSSNRPPRNNKLSYAYSGAVAAGYPKAATSTSSTLSLHTSAHTLTLNSHSANNSIMDNAAPTRTSAAAAAAAIIGVDSNATTATTVNAIATSNNSSGAAAAATVTNIDTSSNSTSSTATTTTTNNKSSNNKTMVRKNNFIMEVT